MNSSIMHIPVLGLQRVKCKVDIVDVVLEICKEDNVLDHKERNLY